MNPRILAGIIISIIGICEMILSVSLFSSAIDRNQLTEELIRKSEISCREQIVKIVGASQNGAAKINPLENGMVEVEFGELKGDPRKSLEEMTAILAVCPARSIKEACIGAGCNAKDGVKDTIRASIKLDMSSRK